MRDTNRMRDRIELQLDNRQIVSFVIGSMVVLGVVFALGVLVGKQLAVGSMEPAEPADPLAAIDEKERARAALAAAPDVGTPENPLTFASELTKPKPVDPIIEPTRPAKGEKAPEAAAEKKAPEPAAEAEVEPAKKASIAAAFDKAAGEPAREAPAGAAFAIQVASLESKADADKEVAKLKGKGFDAYVVEADIPGKGHFFRVRVGGFASRADAEPTLAQLKDSGIKGIIANAK